MLVFTNIRDSLTTMLRMIKSPLKWPLRFSVPLERWSSDSGKFVLVGDAAHVVPSFLAQGEYSSILLAKHSVRRLHLGAAMAIEDAALLEDLFAGTSCKEEISRSIRTFEDTRMRRKIKVQELSLHNLSLYHLEDGEEQRNRDSLQSGDKELYPIWRNVEEQSWLYGYDVSKGKA